MSARLFSVQMRASQHSRPWAHALLGVLVLAVTSMLPPRHAAAPSQPGDPTGTKRMQPPPTPTYRLTGRVVDETGSAVTGAQLQLHATPAQSASHDHVPASRPPRPANPGGGRARQATILPAAAAHGSLRERTWHATSDERGRFAFEGLPRGHYTLDARAPLHEPTVRPAIGVPRDVPLALTMQRSGAVAGTVEGPDGPVAGAAVYLAGSGLWPPRRVETDASGRFELTRVPEGIYELHATSEAFVSLPLEPLHVRPGERSEARLRLKRGATLRGRVVGAADGLPIPDARLLLSDAGLSAMPLPVRTDQDGRFVCKALRPGPHRVSVRAEGYVPIRSRRVRPSDALLELRLQRAAVIEGRVVDESRAPVPHARLRVSGTTSEGEPFTMSALSATLRGALFEAPQASSSDLQVSGHLGVTRGPVPSVSDLPALPELDMDALGPDPSSGYVTDAQGHFYLEGVPPGSARVIAMHPQHAPGTSEPLDLKPGEHLQSLDVTMPHGGIVAGRVVDADGYPLPEVRVQLVAEHDPFPRIVLTDDEGRFEMDRVHGPCRISAHPVGLPVAQRQLSVTSNAQHHVELTIQEASHRLGGRVLDADDQPVDHAAIHVRAPQGNGERLWTAHSASDGTFEVGALPEPPYTVRVEHVDFAPTELSQVEAEHVEVTLQRGVRVRGRLLDDWTQKPVSDVRVLLQGDGGSWQDDSDNQGHFSFHRIPPGRYAVRIDSPVHLAVRRSFELAPLEPGEPFRRLKPFWLQPGGSISGRVVGRFGSAIESAQVAVGQPAAWDRAVKTDANGAFELRGLPPGRTSVRARLDADAEATSEPAATRVFAKQRTPGVMLRLDVVVEETEPSSAGSDVAEPETLQLAFREGRVVATGVPHPSAVFRAGLRKGDIVLAIDGERVLSVGRAKGMLRGPAPGAADVVLQRGGRKKRIRVPR